MRKIILLPIFLLIVVGTNAQIFTVFGQGVGYIYVGPKAGATFSTISNYSDMFPGVKTANRVGYQFGGVAEFGFTEKFSIQTELLFYSRGMKFTDVDGGIKMNYIGIPILAKYAFKAFGLTKIYAIAGTFNDVRTKGEWYDPAGTSELGSGFRKYDWGFSFGCGAEYPTDYGIFGLDLRYNLGLTDLHDDAGDNTKTKSRSFGVALTYKYDLTKLLPKNRKKEKQ
ncbi:MAG TPA: hypothetical protein DIW31_05795 [Bacteroidales bacterium]|nr:hypothetical protein [Bacteroidales bacterium]